MNAIANQLDAFGESMIAWSRPTGWPASPASKWPLANFSSAAFIAVAYLAFVFFGRNLLNLLLSFIIYIHFGK